MRAPSPPFSSAHQVLRDQLLLLQARRNLPRNQREGGFVFIS